MARRNREILRKNEPPIVPPQYIRLKYGILARPEGLRGVLPRTNDEQIFAKDSLVLICVLLLTKSDRAARRTFQVLRRLSAVAKNRPCGQPCASSCVSHFSTSRAHRERFINSRKLHLHSISYGAEPATPLFLSSAAAHTLGRHRNVNTTHTSLYTLSHTHSLSVISYFALISSL
ncbi:hypothetical protein HYPSUDRAFT_1002847 [Hypholoma sublateritium FD-334 SS-4]|uniref:Uncharacterized protein n=1 Tax=Hypholoma sublateritium (strain FD-334 SS-4) TaxID=945553 RepID=A0A0D2PBZ5_HYPSF|nr:hypothetical protein HYPSUDRAFT_1002847 [Hypholoma sublateritium FD-334 SS-4]